MSKGVLKLFEFMRHYLWKFLMTVNKAWFYLSIFLLITNQFGSVQKMKLHNGRVIFEDEADGHLEPHGFHLIDVLPKGSKFHAGYYISHISSYRRSRKFLLVIKMTEGDIL
jgi:hypothetical protein